MSRQPKVETVPLNIDPVELSARMLAFVLNYGTEMTRGAAPCDGTDSECWTNAWTQRGVLYCEGAVQWPTGKWTTHAWTLSPFGTVVEHTPGYDKVVRYRGFIIDRDGPAALASLAWKGWRSSIIEAALANVDPETLLPLLRKAS